MAISISTVTVTAPNQVQIQFNLAPLQNSALYRKDNYTFNVRFGDNVPIYASQVESVNSTTVCVWLTDAMLTGGNYQIAIFNVSASDGIPIQDGGGNTSNFVGDGVTRKCVDIRKRVPSWWKTAYGSNIFAVMCAMGKGVHDAGGFADGTAYTELRNSMLLRTAEGVYLSYLGQNFGVVRPTYAANDDVLFRQLIPLYATKRKCVLKIFYDALTAVLGDQNVVGWRLFEVAPNTLVVEVSADTILGEAGAGLGVSTYLHADASIPSATTYPGDYLVENASWPASVVGDNVIVLFQLSTVVASMTDVLNRIKAAGIEFTIETF